MRGHLTVGALAFTTLALSPGCGTIEHDPWRRYSCTLTMRPWVPRPTGQPAMLRTCDCADFGSCHALINVQLDHIDGDVAHVHFRDRSAGGHPEVAWGLYETPTPIVHCDDLPDGPPEQSGTWTADTEGLMVEIRPFPSSIGVPPPRQVRALAFVTAPFADAPDVRWFTDPAVEFVQTCSEEP
jgi:hypothetical protein